MSFSSLILQNIAFNQSNIYILYRQFFSKIQNQKRIVGYWKLCYIRYTEQPCYKVESLPHLCESQNSWRREVMQMDTYEVFSLLFLGGSFLLALLAYIDRNNKRK